MAAHAHTGRVAVEVPLRGRGGEDVLDVHAKGGKDAGQFVDQGDVEVALHVFDDLRGLGDLQTAHVTDVLARQLGVQPNEGLAHFRVRTTDDTRHRADAVRRITWVEALGAIGDGHVNALLQSEFVEKRKPRFRGHAGINRGLEDHDRVGAARKRFEHGSPGRRHVTEVRLQVVRDRRWNGDQDHVAMRDGFGGRGGDVPAGRPGRRNEIVHVRVAGGVAAFTDRRHGPLGDVHAPDFESSVKETNRGRQSDVAEPDDAHGGRGRVHAGGCCPRRLKGSVTASIFHMVLLLRHLQQEPR